MRPAWSCRLPFSFVCSSLSLKEILPAGWAYLCIHPCRRGRLLPSLIGTGIHGATRTAIHEAPVAARSPETRRGPGSDEAVATRPAAPAALAPRPTRPNGAGEQAAALIQRAEPESRP